MESKRIKAQLWDNMQYYFHEYNDATMRWATFYNGTFDIELLKKAAVSVIEKFPIVNSKFIPAPIKAYWKRYPTIDIEQFFEFFTTTEATHRAAVLEYISKGRDPRKGRPIRIAVFRKDENGVQNDCLVLHFSHLVADGSGFTLFMRALSDTYNHMAVNPNYTCKYEMGNRDYKQFYKYLSKEECVRAKQMTNYRHEKNERLKLPIESYRPEFQKRILTHTVEGFGAIRKYCKAHGFTFNDVILAAYLIALMKHVRFEEGQSLAIDCVLNLRRYMPQDMEINFCNLVSKIKVSLGNDLGATFHDTCKLVHEFMDRTKNDLGGLGGLTLLNLMDRIFPFAIGKILIKIFYQNPYIGVSNIGKVEYKTVTFNGLNPVDLIVTGAMKYAPYMMLSLVTFGDSIYFTLPIACSDNDLKIFQDILDDVSSHLEEFAK
ncbi:MAG: condensation domain-containing protein [Clostridiales bacterium]|jgi:NRPS condensation-like uncharacterized protein|nr:condensation domain-containing protein [Clostridiales bacterium]